MQPQRPAQKRRATGPWRPPVAAGAVAAAEAALTMPSLPFAAVAAPQVAPVISAAAVGGTVGRREAAAAGKPVAVHGRPTKQKGAFAVCFAPAAALVAPVR